MQLAFPIAVTAPLAPRKLPRQARARAAVEAMLEAAAHILRRDGLAGFTTNAVAERAGVSIGSLYQYFPNKDALMAALIGREQIARVADLARVVDKAIGLPLADGLTVLVEAALARDREQGALAAILDLEERRLPLDAAIETARAALDLELARFLAAHWPHLPAPDRLIAGRSLRLIAQALIDGWAGDPASARAEALRAGLGYLAGLGTSSGGGLRGVSICS